MSEKDKADEVVGEIKSRKLPKSTAIETGLGIGELAIVAAEVLLGNTFKSRVAIMDTELVNFLEFDALISVTYTGNAQVTDHPVEGLLDVTDHIRRLPKELRLNGIVTNHPVMALASFRATGAVNGGDPSARAEEAFAFLESIKDGGQLVHVSTSLFDIENMAITALGCTRDKESGNIADIVLTCREIIIATTEKVAPAGPKVKRANIGKQAKKAASAPVAASSGTLLTRLIGLVVP